MIEPHKDLFAHLVISANKIKKNPDYLKIKNIPLPRPKIYIPPKKKEFIKALISDELSDESSLGIRPVEVKKVDIHDAAEFETVDHVNYRREVDALNSELKNLENIFKELQKKETNVDLLLKLDSKIKELKKIIAEKSRL